MTFVHCQTERLELEKKKKGVNVMRFLRQRSLRRALSISVVLHLSQQISGINGVCVTPHSHSHSHSLLPSHPHPLPPSLPPQVLYYSTQIFSAAGVRHADVPTVVVGVVLVLFTLITVSGRGFRHSWVELCCLALSAGVSD